MAEQDQPHGILVVDKPAGLTSHDVVARARRILKTKRVGHTGTLDPFATGVLVLLIGKATRLAQFIDKDDKEYEALVRFGHQTDTGDKTGTRTADSGLADEEIAHRLERVDWDIVLSAFRGDIEQVPPMYSAKKVEGKKLYELARAGKEIERKPVTVTIKQLELIHENGSRDPQSAIRIRVVCSAGTYIRTLAEDIGRSIGVGAHLQELTRTRAGRFGLNESVTLEAIENVGDPKSLLMPIEEAVINLPEFTLRADRVEKTLSGLPTRANSDGFGDGDHVRIIDEDKNLVAIGVFQKQESQVKPTIVLTCK
jgi:tRNA pseudouridine55 synthase